MTIQKLRFFKVCLICIAFCFIQCSPQKKIAEVTPIEEEVNSIKYQPLEKALLWKIASKNDTGLDSYLFGTIHMIDAQDFFLPEGTQQAISQSKQMVFEIDMAKMNSMGAQMSMLGKIFMKDGLTLKDLLNEDDFKEVREYFDGKGLPMMFVQRIKPLFLSAMTEFDLESMDMFSQGQNSSIKSYEMEFYEIAKSEELSTNGLETIDYQLEVFDAIPYEAQAEMLLEAIRSTDSGSEEMEQLVEAYKAQDIESLVQSIGSNEEYGQFEDILLNDRNANWIPIMSEMMTEQPTFFAVGAGHLAGEKGVIHLLRLAGYTVTPILKDPMKRI